MCRILVRWQSFANDLKIFGHTFCNWLYKYTQVIWPQIFTTGNLEQHCAVVCGCMWVLLWVGVLVWLCVCVCLYINIYMHAQVIRPQILMGNRQHHLVWCVGLCVSLCVSVVTKTHASVSVLLWVPTTTQPHSHINPPLSLMRGFSWVLLWVYVWVWLCVCVCVHTYTYTHTQVMWPRGTDGQLATPRCFIWGCTWGVCVCVCACGVVYI